MKQSLWDRLDPAIKLEIEKECKTYSIARNIKNKLTLLKYQRYLTWGDILNINLYGNTNKLLTPKELFKN